MYLVSTLLSSATVNGKKDHSIRFVDEANNFGRINNSNMVTIKPNKNKCIVCVT